MNPTAETEERLTPQIEDLAQLLDEAIRLFDNMIGPWSTLLFPHDYREPLARAWEELKPRLESELGTFRDSRDEYEEKLEKAGLTGMQLDLKLKGLRHVWGRFMLRGTVPRLQSLLEWLNDLLGSFGKAIPGVEALEEVKKLIEKLLGAEDGEYA